MKPVSNPLRRMTACTLAALTLAGLAATAPAHAANHALIMWIGDYGNPRADLPGIDLDAANARKIALAMGVPQANITEISNAQLTGENMAKGMVGLLKRINDGDKVFLYYSGHGAQVPGHETNAKCTEALVARDGLVLDADMQTVLTALGQKASQVVMMNDSCFSGGAATKTLAAPPDGAKPKFLPPDVKTNSSVTSGYSCGDATNSTKMARSLSTMAKDARGPQVLYIAASNDTQVSFATREGSIGTLAWAACMQAAHADADRSGRINGEELQLCAQNFIDRRRTKQTITLQGNAQLPLSFVKGDAAAPAPAQQTAAAAAPAPAQAAASPTVNAARALHDLQAAADRALQVQISTARNSLRVGVDFLDFSVSTANDGYLYLLQVGSDGKTFNLLFPNKLDDNNFLTAGTHRFPRQSWRVRAGGPAGASHILAIVSPVKKDLSRGMDVSSVFPHNTANNNNTRTLVVEASGADSGGSGRYGASAVVTINETAP
ncbi:MAG: DUF4384 domain-containing protein [Rubrivivax sp.]|jgi:hypothetical protein|nr:DUF4384 domain-containing protein [Rubrivivax sp.]